VSVVNTVFNTIFAKKYKEFADWIDAGEKPDDVAREALNKQFKVIFNGDSYNLENQDMFTEKVPSNISSCVEAIHRLCIEKTLDFFEKLDGLPPPGFSSISVCLPGATRPPKMVPPTGDVHQCIHTPRTPDFDLRHPIEDTRGKGVVVRHKAVVGGGFR
jgi:hypothetical protein